MSETRILNLLLSCLLLMTVLMFAWTFSFVNKTQAVDNTNVPVVSAFNA